MNKYRALGLFGAGLMVSPLLGNFSAQSAVPANPKIGVIDIENTLSTTPAGKRANEAFEKNRKTKQADLDKRQEDLKKQAEPLIAKIAKAEGVTVILDQNGVVWADPTCDLTQKLNAEMK